VRGENHTGFQTDARKDVRILRMYVLAFVAINKDACI
jgi:hypothetical protein